MQSKFNTLRTILILQAVICIASCSPQNNKTPEGSAGTQVNAENQNAAATDAAQPRTDNPSETDRNTTVLVPKTNIIPAFDTPRGMPKPPCMAGGTYDGTQCVCGDMKYPAETAAQWTCFGDFLRCLRKEGCQYNDVTYPAFAKLKAGTVTCGDDNAPENPDGFVCSTNVRRYEYMLSLDLQKNKENPDSAIWLFDGFTKHELDADKAHFSSDEPRERNLFWTSNGEQDIDIKPEQDYWVCAKDQCECHGIKIENTDICTNQKVLSVYFPDYITENDNICSGMIYPAKSHHFGYDCRDGNWVCVGKDCQCPSQIKDGRQEYKTIHLGDVCKMDGNIPVRPADRETYEYKFGLNHYQCDSEDELMNIYTWMKDSQCYCGDTYTDESFEGGCAYITYAAVTVYCMKKIDDESIDDKMKLDEKSGLYIANIYGDWGGGAACPEDEFDDEQEDPSETEQDSATDNAPSDNTEPKTDETDKKEPVVVPENTDESQDKDANTKTTDVTPDNAKDSQTQEPQTNHSAELHFYARQWFDDDHPLCMDYEGCRCDETICPMTTACVDGKCMDPVTKSEIRYGDFLPTIQCSTPEACGCSQKKCAQGEWCVAGNCYSEIVASILRNETTNEDERDFYNIYGVTVNHPDGIIQQYNFDDKMIYNGLAFNGNITIFQEIYQAMKQGYSNTDQEIIEYRGCCGDEGDEHYQSFRCALSNGCPCGASTCQMGGICENGLCKYDQYYIDMMCYENENTEEHHLDEGKFFFEPENPAIRVDDAGNCVCHGTRLSPKLFNTYKEQYICGDYGWLCTQSCGCTCGDVMCDANSLCIAPGVCSEPLPGNEYQKAAKREDCYRQASDINKPSNDRINTPKQSYNNFQRQNDCKRNHCVMNRFGYCCGSVDEKGMHHFNGVLDEIGDCCFSGVLDASGHCDTQAAPHPSPTDCILDSHGLCCDTGVLDLAGRCCPKDAIGENGKCYIKDALWQYCKTGVLDHEDQCCSSGVLDKSNHCCEKGTLAKNGECCDKELLDAEGNCCKTGLENGKCQCNTGVFSKNGKCCPEYNVETSHGKKTCTCDLLDDNGSCCYTNVLSKSGICCADKYVENGRCTCESGVFSGNANSGKCCENGLKDAAGNCCDTGVLSDSGNCCPKWHIGSQGQCLCPTDEDGQCCVLNRFGKCCNSYRIDGCGYCTE